MRPSLQQKLGELAAEFAQSIVALLQDQPLSMLTGEGGHVTTAPKPARAPRASKGEGGRRGPEQMAALIEQIVHAVKAAPEGLRSEQIQKATDLDKREIVRPLQLALKQGLLRKVGEKRSTSYFSPGSEARGARKPAAKKLAKRKAAAKPKKVARSKSKAHKVVAKPKAAKKAEKHDVAKNSAPAVSAPAAD
jgi:hypothetical protein